MADRAHRRELTGSWGAVARRLQEIAGSGRSGSVELAPTEAAALLYLLRGPIVASPPPGEDPDSLRRRGSL